MGVDLLQQTNPNQAHALKHNSLFDGPVRHVGMTGQARKPFDTAKTAKKQESGVSRIPRWTEHAVETQVMCDLDFLLDWVGVFTWESMTKQTK